MKNTLLLYRTHFSGARLLTLDNPLYRRAVEAITLDELSRDMSSAGDITTNSFFIGQKKIEAKIIAKSAGIFAGRPEAEFFLKTLKIQHSWHLKDGDHVKKGTALITLHDAPQKIFAIERSLLNLLGRMSGIATLTYRLLKKVGRSQMKAPVAIAPTRKTLWGLVDKRACAVGGGATHRLNIADAVLIKHPHIAASGISIEQYLVQTLKNISKFTPRFVEVEVASEKDAYTVAAVFAHAQKNGLTSPCALLFDNMSPALIKKSLHSIKHSFPQLKIVFEASGGITPKNIRTYARTGVDVLSMGCLTNGASVLDLSLRVCT